MITKTLLSALNRADSPTSVKMLLRGLEFVTGKRTAELLGLKSFDIGSFSTTDPLGQDWYTLHGFNKIANALYGYSSYTGRSISFDAVLESSAVYACVKIIAEDIGATPQYLLKRTADRTWSAPAYDHTLYEVLETMPNPDMNSSSFKECITTSALLAKDGYARIDRDSKGEVLYLWPLMAGSVRRDKNSYGRPFFIWKDGNAPEKTFEANQVFNVPGFSLNGTGGDDILRRARHVFGLTLATQEYPGRFFANDANPGLILTRPAGATELDGSKIAAIKEAWKRWHQGMGKSHEPAIIQDGMTASRLDPDHTKLQMDESRKFQVIEVCRLFRMQPHKLAALERSTNNNIEHQSIEYVRDTFMPVANRWNQSASRCLLSATDRAAGLYTEFDYDRLLRGDFLSQATAWAMLQDKGDMTQNEVRRILKLPPADGGNELRVQLNTESVATVAASIMADRRNKQLELIEGGRRAN